MPPQTTTPSGLDPQIVNLAQAIRQVESNNNPTAQGKSGEFGAYQWEPATWAAESAAAGVNVPLQQATLQQQNEVAYKTLAAWKQQNPSWNIGNFASAWNAGQGAPNAYLDNNVGTNSDGVAYNTPQYAANVANAYQAIKNGTATQTPAAQTSGLPTYGATFAASPEDNPLVAGFKALGNIPSSVYGVGAGLVNAALHPIQTVENLGSAAIGGVENLTGENQGNPDQYQQTANSLGQAFMQRYGSLANLQNTATNDPFGFGADVASILAGGAGLADRGALAAGEELGATDALGSAGSKVAQTALKPVAGAVDAIGNAAGAVLGRANPEAIAAADRVGATLPASAYTDNKVIQTLDTLGATGLGSARSAQRVEDAVDAMDGYAQKLIDSTGSTGDLTEAGENISKGLDQFETLYQKANAANYKAIDDAVGDVGAQTSRVADTLQKIIADKDTIGDTSNLKFFKDKLAVVTGGKTESEFVPMGEKIGKVEGKQYPAPTFDTVKRLKTSVGQMIDRKFDDPFVKTNIVELKKLYGALSDSEMDTLRATGRKDLVSQYQKTKAAYIAGRREISSQFGKTIMRLANNGQYSKIVDALIKPTTAVEDIPRILNVAGEQGANDIRASLMSRIFESARNAEGDFTPEGIARQIKKYNAGGTDRLSLILKPEQYQGLKDMGTVSKALGTALKMAKGSQTAFLTRTLVEMGAVGTGAYKLLTGDLIGGLQLIGGVIGSEGASIFISSDTGQRLLRLAIDRGANFAQAPEAAKAAASQPATAKTNSLDEAYAKAPEAKEHIDSVSDEIASDVGGTVAKTDIKGRDRAEEKAAQDYGGDASRVTDIARNTIVAPDYESYQRAIDSIRSRDDVVALKETKEGDDPTGYTGAIAKIKTPNGHVAEIQVNTPDMIYAKEPEDVARKILGDEKYTELQKTLGIEGGEGHSLYEKMRSKDKSSPAYKALAEQSKVYYNAIRRAAQGETSEEQT